MNKRRLLLLGALSQALATACGPLVAQTNTTRNTRMSKVGWKTHCFGRHLVDLPPDAKISNKYALWNSEIVWLKHYSADTTRAEVDRRESELMAQKHESEGTLLYSRITHTDGSISLVSWDNPRTKRFLTMTTFFRSNTPNRTFLYVSGTTKEKVEQARRFRDELSQSLRPRNENEIPTNAGFCIDGGFIEGKQLMAESFQVTASFASHPGASLSINAYVQGKVDEPLLKRTGQVAGLIQGFAGMSTLRKRERPIGTLYGEEYLVAGSDQGQRLYAFRWEAPGKANSLAEPAIGVSLSVLAQDEPPPKPPFASDDDALGLWDAIIDSIRLRPGAV